jgi:uncharacterized coiled-coil protein SlyX
MHTARLTVLMPPERKAKIERDAAEMGVSSGEYMRLAVDNIEKLSAEEEAELAALVAEANVAIPKMAETMDRISQRLQVMHEETDAFLRKMGVRK